MKNIQFKDIIHSDKISLFIFSAAWCGSCREMWNLLNELLENYNNNCFQFQLIDINEAPELAEEMGIIGVPTMYLFNTGKLKYASLGVKTRNELKDILDAHLYTSHETPVR